VILGSYVNTIFCLALSSFAVKAATSNLRLYTMTIESLTGIVLVLTDCGSHKLVRVDNEDTAIVFYSMSTILFKVLS